MTFVDAATMVCARRTDEGKIQVLLGQNEVKNWIRSTRSRSVVMRYPGEYKLPGGVFDANLDQNLQDTAVRETHEEMLVPIDELKDAVVDLLGVVKTRVIKGKGYLMHNFIAWESDNSWIQQIDTQQVNQKLNQRIVSLQEFINDETFWEMKDEEKEIVSPEVHRIDWIDIDEAIELMRSSLDIPIVYVNDWQRKEFRKYNVRRRDPMRATELILRNVRDHNQLPHLTSEL